MEGEEEYVDNIDIDCNCRFCCANVNDGDLQTKYATEVGDVTSTSYKVAKAFEWLLLIAVVGEMFIAIACFIFGVYLNYLRQEDAKTLQLTGNSSSAQLDSNQIVSFLTNIPIFLITMGVLMVAFICVGAAGALRHYLPFLGVYLGFLLAITLCELVVISAFLNNKDALAIAIRDEFSTNGIKNYFDDSDLKYIIDYVQVRFNCCGSGNTGYQEWNSNQYFNCSLSNPAIQRCSVPPSCCINASVSNYSNTVLIINTYCGLGTLSPTAKNVESKINIHGCFDSVLDFIRSYEGTIVVIVGAVTIVPLLEEAFIIYIIHYLRKERRTYEYWKATGSLPPSNSNNSGPGAMVTGETFGPGGEHNNDVEDVVINNNNANGYNNSEHTNSNYYNNNNYGNGNYYYNNNNRM